MSCFFFHLLYTSAIHIRKQCSVSSRTNIGSCGPRPRRLATIRGCPREAAPLSTGPAREPPAGRCQLCRSAPRAPGRPPGSAMDVGGAGQELCHVNHCGTFCNINVYCLVSAGFHLACTNWIQYVHCHSLVYEPSHTLHST